MTLLEIYNAVSYRLFGAPANYPDGYDQQMRGIIRTVCKRIQRDRNYWFMEASEVIPILAGDIDIDLPTNFKEIIRCGFRLLDDDGEQLSPLLQLVRGQQFLTSNTATTEYPLYYYVFAGSLRVLPIPSKDVTLVVDYYGYLDDLIEDEDEDNLSIEGDEAIINLACFEWCNMTKEFDEGQRYLAFANEALTILGETDVAKRYSESREIPYGDF